MGLYDSLMNATNSVGGNVMAYMHDKYCRGCGRIHRLCVCDDEEETIEKEK